MAKDFNDWLDEDECCLNCGDFQYKPSKTPGICFDCATEVFGQKSEARPDKSLTPDWSR